MTTGLVLPGLAAAYLIMKAWPQIFAPGPIHPANSVSDAIALSVAIFGGMWVLGAVFSWCERRSDDPANARSRWESLVRDVARGARWGSRRLSGYSSGALLIVPGVVVAGLVVFALPAVLAEDSTIAPYAVHVRP